MTRHFEDIAVGETDRFGSYEVTRDEIVDFAERWDPQPFHLDEAEAEDSMFGGLVASGWHTACICMRLMVEGYLSDAASMGSPGIDELRWLEPVRPGDVLSVRVEVLDKRPSEGLPGTGIVRHEWVVEDADGTPKMRMESPGFIAMRSEADG